MESNKSHFSIEYDSINLANENYKRKNVSVTNKLSNYMESSNIQNKDNRYSNKTDDIKSTSGYAAVDAADENYNRIQSAKSTYIINSAALKPSYIDIESIAAEATSSIIANLGSDPNILNNITQQQNL